MVIETEPKPNQKARIKSNLPYRTVSELTTAHVLTSPTIPPEFKIAFRYLPLLMIFPGKKDLIMSDYEITNQQLARDCTRIKENPALVRELNSMLGDLEQKMAIIRNPQGSKKPQPQPQPEHPDTDNISSETKKPLKPKRIPPRIITEQLAYETQFEDHTRNSNELTHRFILVLQEHSQKYPTKKVNLAKVADVILTTRATTHNKWHLLKEQGLLPKGLEIVDKHAVKTRAIKKLKN